MCPWNGLTFIECNTWTSVETGVTGASDECGIVGGGVKGEIDRRYNNLAHATAQVYQLTAHLLSGDLIYWFRR